jgi:LmbE family N-acetylglucosaminyl deacetylase
MLTLNQAMSQPRQVLCLGAHCDDIEIGCGGMLLSLRRRHPGLAIHWAVFSGEDARQAETSAAAARLIGEGSGSRLELHAFRGSYFPSQFDAIKDRFEQLKARLRPDLILTHFLDDRHQDHRVIAELTWNTFRDHPILEYEIPKFEGDLGHPNCFFALDANVVDAKVDTLMECFPTQRARSWFEPSLFRALMRLRGMECNAPSGFAEAFHARKIAL